MGREEPRGEIIEKEAEQVHHDIVKVKSGPFNFIFRRRSSAAVKEGARILTAAAAEEKKKREAEAERIREVEGKGKDNHFVEIFVGRREEEKTAEDAQLQPTDELRERDQRLPEVEDNKLPVETLLWERQKLNYLKVIKGLKGRVTKKL